MSENLKTALILCAGYGTRLRPLTDKLPKPLLPVRGKPAIFAVMDKLRAAGVNLHSLAIIESAEPGNIVFREEA